MSGDEDITLREHLSRIQSAGGKGRAAKLSAKRLSAIGRKAGKKGGKAAAAAMTPEERTARAKKAAAKSAEVRKAKAAEREAKGPGAT